MAKLKTIEIEGATYAELNASGAPVYLDDSGAEVGYDAPELAATVGQLTKDLRTTKSELTKAANKLTAFGDLDATAAKKALETVAALDSDKLVDAERINEVRTTTISEMEAKYQPIEAERDSLREQLYAEIVDGNFARSSYVRDQLVTPPQMVQATFGQHFKVEEGQLRAYGHDGNPLYSPSKPSERASFEEAIKLTREGLSNAQALNIASLEAHGRILEVRALRGAPPVNTNARPGARV